MTFLELCRAVARDSGTVADLTAPATVTGQTGRLLRIVNWTREAYNDIQRLRDDWRWLRTDFEGETLANVQHYKINPSSRFKHWIFEAEDGSRSFTAYKTADGRDGEAGLTYKPWPEFRRRFMFGAAADDTGAPAYITVDPQDQLVLHPIPDGAYTLRGEYYQSPQSLAADADVPEMPVAHHEAIKWRALILMGAFDEAVEQIPAWAQFLHEHVDALTRTQTSRIQLGGPLA